MARQLLLVIGALAAAMGGAVALAQAQTADASSDDLEELMEEPLTLPDILDFESARPEIIGSAPGPEVIEVGPIPPGTLDGLVEEAEDAPEPPSMSME